MNLEEAKNYISNHPFNKENKQKGLEPLFSFSKTSKIAVIGQTPGNVAQTKQIHWGDLSGRKLMEWFGVSSEEFYDVSNFAHIPMDFYYPGKGKNGDLPPRRAFADLFHKLIFEQIEDLQLTILIGNYAQAYYLEDKNKLTYRVKNFENYLPRFFPLPHPSPRNGFWYRANPWFEEKVLPMLKQEITKILRKAF